MAASCPQTYSAGIYQCCFAFLGVGEECVIPWMHLPNQLYLAVCQAGRCMLPLSSEVSQVAGQQSVGKINFGSYICLPLYLPARMVEAGRDLWRSSCWNTLLKQGHLEQVAQDHV